MLLVTRQVVNILMTYYQILNENNMTINKVTNITEWVRNIKEGEVKYASFPRSQAHSVRCTVSNYNKAFGIDRNIFVHFHFCYDEQVAVLVAVSLDEREITKNTEHEYDWRQEIEKPYNR